MAITFNIFKELINANKLRIEDDYLTSENISEDDFRNWFVNYPLIEYDDEIGTVPTEKVEFIFDSTHKFVEAVDLDNFNSQHNEIYIIDQGFVDVKNFAKAYLNWLELIKLASKHDYVSKPPSSKKTFIIVDGSGATEVIAFDFSSWTPCELLNLIQNIADPISLLKSCSQDDAHKTEKLSVLKTSVLKWFNKHSNSKLSILNSGVQLIELFHLNYETYLRSFSFDDFIKDLEDDVSEFINKVEEQVQGFYIQALAVPGSVILASALRGAENRISLALIFSAALALTLVFRSLTTKIKFIDRVTSNTKEKLDIYKRKADDISNSYAKESISKKIDSSISQINDINKESKTEIGNIRDTIMIFIIMYFIASVLFPTGL